MTRNQWHYWSNLGSKGERLVYSPGDEVSYNPIEDEPEPVLRSFVKIPKSQMENLGSTIEEEVRIARRLKLKEQTIAYLKGKGHGKRGGARKGSGRKRKYHKDRPASYAEKCKAYRARKKAKEAAI